MIARITKAYIRTYSDSGQIVAYVEWIDHKRQIGRTEGKQKNTHMKALLDRAQLEGMTVERQRW